MNSGAPLVTLAAHGYRLSVSPLHGASLTGLTWQAKSGEVSILRPCDASTLSIGEPSPVSCFVMAPFANRIDGGVFTYDGRRHTLAINRPEEDVAIHGLSRWHRLRSSITPATRHDCFIVIAVMCSRMICSRLSGSGSAAFASACV